MFRVSDLADVTITPQTNYVQLWRHKITLNKPEHNPESFLGNIILGNIQFLKIRFFKFWERRVPTNPGDPSNIFENLEQEIKIYQKHEL